MLEGSKFPTIDNSRCDTRIQGYGVALAFMKWEVPDFSFDTYRMFSADTLSAVTLTLSDTSKLDLLRRRLEQQYSAPWKPIDRVEDKMRCGFVDVEWRDEAHGNNIECSGRNCVDEGHLTFLVGIEGPRDDRLDFRPAIFGLLVADNTRPLAILSPAFADFRFTTSRLLGSLLAMLVIV